LWLASSGAWPHQAVRVGESAWGIQFHPEVTESIIRDWCAWDTETAAKADELIAAFTAEAANFRATSRLLLENFIASISETTGSTP